jgi:DNA-binding MarR family transcriptional regulator
VSHHSLDPVIHPPKRLAAMALLAHAQDADFRFLRDHLELSDSDLSKQMAELARAGYVDISKHGRGPGATTTYRITRAGRRAYAAYRGVLAELLSAPEQPVEDRPR